MLHFSYHKNEQLLFLYQVFVRIKSSYRAALCYTLVSISDNLEVMINYICLLSTNKTPYTLLFISYCAIADSQSRIRTTRSIERLMSIYAR
jgi:hypothetical protein